MGESKGYRLGMCASALIAANFSGCSGKKEPSSADSDSAAVATSSGGASTGSTTGAVTVSLTSSSTGDGTGQVEVGDNENFDASRPIGLQLLPNYVSCPQGDEACNGACISQETPVSERCELAAAQWNAAGAYLADDGWLYVSHFEGIGRVMPGSGSYELEPLTTDTDFAGPMLLEQDYIYFGRTLSDVGFWRVPREGGAAELLGELAYVGDIVSDGSIVAITTSYGSRWATWDGERFSEDEASYSNVHLGDGIAYLYDGTAVVSVPFADPSNETAVGGAPLGDFVLVDGQMYAVGSGLNNLYFHGQGDIEPAILWQEGEDAWDGSIVDIRTSPYHAAVFFVFQTDTRSYLMMYDTSTETFSHLVNIDEACFYDEYFISPDHAYVSGCQMLVRVPLPR